MGNQLPGNTHSNESTLQFEAVVVPERVETLCILQHHGVITVDDARYSTDCLITQNSRMDTHYGPAF